MEHIINFFKGMIIGIANIIPGVSGGTLAVSLNIYDKLINIIGNFFKDFKKNFIKNIIFILPIGLGAVIGIVAFSKLLEYLLANYNMQTKFAFIGLILGTLPFIMKKSNEKGFKKSYIIPCIITFAFGLTLSILQFLGITGTEIQNFNLDLPTIFLLFLYGVIAASSMVIPGISGSFVLMLLGAYYAILNAVSTLNILVLLPFAVGVGVGILGISKLIDFLLNKFYGFTYYAIIGFIIGSIFAIYPGFAFNIAGFVSILILIVCFVFSYIFSKKFN